MNRIQTRMSQAGVGLKELIATLVVAALLMIIGIYVFSTVNANINLTSDATADKSRDAIVSTTYNAFQLATVALIVLAAAVIIGILIRSFSA